MEDKKNINRKGMKGKYSGSINDPHRQNFARNEISVFPNKSNHTKKFTTERLYFKTDFKEGNA